MNREIKTSSCCDAVMVNENWCVCCDRFSKPKQEQKSLTVSEALKEGYTFAFYNEEILKAIEEIDEEDLEEMNITLASKQGKPFQIQESTIAKMVDQFFCDQDEVYSEELVATVNNEVDFASFAAHINTVIAKHLFYHDTDIRLVPNPHP